MATHLGQCQPSGKCRTCPPTVLPDLDSQRRSSASLDPNAAGGQKQQFESCLGASVSCVTGRSQVLSRSKQGNACLTHFSPILAAVAPMLNQSATDGLCGPGKASN